MAKKKAAKKRAPHGGKRSGAGRPGGEIEWQQLNIRARPAEIEAIEVIRAHYGFATASEAIRWSINTEARRIRAVSPALGK